MFINIRIYLNILFSTNIYVNIIYYYKTQYYNIYVILQYITMVNDTRGKILTQYIITYPVLCCLDIVNLDWSVLSELFLISISSSFGMCSNNSMYRKS